MRTDPTRLPLTKTVRIALIASAAYAAIVVAISIATQHVFVLGFLGLVALGLLPFRRR